VKLQYLLAGVAIVAAPAHAKVYLSAEQAQAILFPGASFTRVPLTLNPGQVSAIEKASQANVLNKQPQVWKVSTGGWVIVDEVVGKHEFIPIAVGIDASGAVKGIEILEYREAYGDQVRDPKWRAQFTGHRPGQPLQLGHEVKNISGATLSSKHITDGVRRLLATYAIAVHGA
jgi:Na+-translocating ferredoxin:NAD+ oxidoreductase RnfG subunit